ncbi:MAG: response regulator [Spirochaetales bacterium]|nr:response regulator [Spirochaetales bacterium]
MENSVKNKQILIVEDENIVRKILEMQISSFGYDVHVAELPTEGIEFFSKNFDSVDLVLLDMNMPEMDGLEVFRQMKRYDPDVKVLVLSGYSQHGKIEAALREGVIDYMTKPVRKAALSDKIDEILNHGVIKDTEKGRISEAVDFDSLPVFNRVFVESQFQTTPGLMKKVVESFLNTAPSLTSALEDAIASGDFIEMGVKAHKCHGPVVSLGGERAGAWVKSLELESENNNIHVINELMSGYKQAFVDLIDVLDKVNKE